MWVFGYGSLMWDGWESSFAPRRIVIATLPGHQRVFNKQSTHNWGTKACPCPTLNIEPKASAVCVGLAFEFDDTQRGGIFAALKSREGSDFEQVDLEIDLQGGEKVQALLSICSKNLVNQMYVSDLVANLKQATGTKGSGVEYVTRTHQRLAGLGIDDPIVSALHNDLSNAHATPTLLQSSTTAKQADQNDVMSEPALIRKLTIKNFRGLVNFEWYPAPGINVLIGGGDVGKSTILEALALLFSPANSVTLSEADYWLRDNTQEFVIEAIVTLPEGTGISSQNTFSWPWAWDGKDAVLPAETAEDEMPAPKNPVYRVRVRGTEQLDIAWEIVQPDDTTSHFSVSVRRKIGLVRLDADERNDRDLRLVYGSALDRLISDNSLRARIAKTVAGLNLHEELSADGKTAIKDLDKRMEQAALPHTLDLGLTSSQGISIGSLIGLVARKEGVSIPLASWGAGTRRLAALEIASSSDKFASMTVIDEIERGLEPYRLRQLIGILRHRKGQVFFTTHSPVAISCTTDAHLWYVGADSKIGELPHRAIAQQQRRDPETFLSKLVVIAEGPTEVGMLNAVLEKAFPSDPLDYGVRVCNGEGNEATLGLLEALAKAGVPFAGFVDDEGKFSGRWGALKDKLSMLLFQWAAGCLEENVINAIADDKLIELLKVDGELDGMRLRTLADRLCLAGKEVADIQTELAATGRTLRRLIIDAATGRIEGAPDKETAKAWEKHERHWFKSELGGRELVAKAVQLDAWKTIEPQLRPFVNAILGTVKLPARTKLEL